MGTSNILIVEDDFLNRRLIKKTLQENNFNTFEAKNAAMGLEILQTENVNLAILDINLGDGEKSGISFAKDIQNEFKIPFIYLTAYDTTNIISDAIQTSPYSYLTKPFKASDLIAAVELALLKFNSEKKEVATLQVRNGEYKVELPVIAIDYIESDGNYLLVHANNTIYKCRSTISQILEILPKSLFVQSHRAFIINKDKIEKFNSHEVYVNGIALPISKTYHLNFL